MTSYPPPPHPPPHTHTSITPQKQRNNNTAKKQSSLLFRRSSENVRTLLVIWESKEHASSVDLVQSNLTAQISIAHTVYPRSEVFSRSSRYSKAQPEQAEAKIEPGKLHRFTSNVGIAPVTDHHGWNGEAFPCPVV